MTVGNEALLVAGALAERARIKAITELPEAKGREATALSLALTTSMSADEVNGVLATLPKAGLASTGRRAGDSPIGLALLSDDAPRASAGTLSPAQVAAAVNAETPR